MKEWVHSRISLPMPFIWREAVGVLTEEPVTTTGWHYSVMKDLGLNLTGELSGRTWGMARLVFLDALD